MTDVLRVVCFLIDGDKVLLGKKGDGIGEGNYIGIGGKQEKGEDIYKALIREVKEEINIEVIDFQEMGKITFKFPHKPNWDQIVIPFICTKWKGEPQNSEEIIPQWFMKDKLPFEKMWDDAKYWIPKVIKCAKVKMEFVYGKDNKIIQNVNFLLT